MGFRLASLLSVEADHDSVSMHDAAHLAPAQIDIVSCRIVRDEKAEAVRMGLDLAGQAVCCVRKGKMILLESYDLSFTRQLCQANLYGFQLFSRESQLLEDFSRRKALSWLGEKKRQYLLFDRLRLSHYFGRDSAESSCSSQSSPISAGRGISITATSFFREARIERAVVKKSSTTRRTMIAFFRSTVRMIPTPS